MGSIIKNTDNKELIIDLSFLKNVAFKDSPSSLDEIIKNLEIKNVTNFNQFINFLTKAYVKSAFICLVDDKTRVLKSKNLVFNAIVRFCFDDVSQANFKDNSFLGFSITIDQKLATLNVNSMFTTRIKPVAQDFETTIVDCPIKVIQYQGSLEEGEVLRRNIINSSNIEQIGKLLSTFEQQNDDWNNYLDFLTDLLNLQRKNSLPYLDSQLLSVIKIDKSSFKNTFEEYEYKYLKNKSFKFLNINCETLLKKLNIDYEYTNIIKLELLVDNIEKLNKIKKTSELSLLAFRNNKLISPIQNLINDPKIIFDFNFDKNLENNRIVDLGMMLGSEEYKDDFLQYWNLKQELLFGGTKELNEFQKKQKQFLTEVSIFNIYFEIEDDFDKSYFLQKNNIDFLTCGYLAYTGIGENILIDRSRTVLKRIADGNTKNPYLVNYLFNTKLLELTESNEDIKIEDNQFIFDLNDIQKDAVRKAINSKDIFILQGPPGTGKTQVICEIVNQLTKLDRKVMVSSQNHEAIKNVIDRLPIDPNINRIRLTNQLNTKSNIANNYSPERVVYNYYKSIGKKIFDDMSDDLINFDEFEKLSNRLEQLILNHNSIKQTDSQIKTLQIELEEIDKTLIELREKVTDNKIQLNELKDELYYIDILINALSNLEFDAVISFSNKINKAYEISIQNELNSFAGENLNINFMAYDNYYLLIKQVFETVFLKNEIYRDILKTKHKIINLKREAEFEQANLEEQRINDLNKLLEKEQLITQLKFIFNKFKNKLDITKKDIEITIKELKAETNNEIKINSLNVSRNEKETLLSNLLKKSNSNYAELKKIIDLINNNFNLSLSASDINLEKKAKEKLSLIEKELLNKKDRRDNFFNLYSNIINFLDESYGIKNNWEEDIATKDFSIQMKKDTQKYHSTILNDLINVYAMTLTSSNIFRFDKDDQTKKLGIEQIELKHLEVDTVIIDEASKATILEILMPLIYGKTLILVGDYRQLPPILKLQQTDVELVNKVFNKNYNYDQIYNLLDSSAFKQLISANNKSITTILTKQYRSHKDIMEVVNNFYNDSLQVDFSVSQQKEHDLIIKNKYNIDLIDSRSSVYWIDSSHDLKGEVAYEQGEEYSTSLFNDLEIDLTVSMLDKLEKTLDEKKLSYKPSVAVISFYGLHVKKLKNKLKNIKHKNFKLIVNTVDDFQGKEADYVFVNIVRNPVKTSTSGREFLKKFERINVAFSRARKLLVIIGARRAVEDVDVKIPDINNPTITNTEEVYRNIILQIESKGGLIDPEQVLD